MVGYYQRFMYMFATKACPLTPFMCEDALTPMENEASKCAFEQFKLAFQATPILRTPN